MRKRKHCTVVNVARHKVYSYVEHGEHEIQACGQGCQVSVPQIHIQIKPQLHLKKHAERLIQIFEHRTGLTCASSLCLDKSLTVERSHFCIQ